MLRKAENRHPDSTAIIGEPQSEAIDFETLLAAARRQLRFVFTCAMGGLLLGLAYLQAEVPLYQSTTRILIDKDQPPVVMQLMENGTSMQLDPMMQSQVELLGSDRIGLKVVDSLGLAADQSFLSAPYSLVDVLKGAVTDFVQSLISSSEGVASGNSAGPRGPDRRRQAFGILANNLMVDRVGESYILQIDFWSPNPEMAQKIVGKYADIYLADQLGAKDEAITRARSALTEVLEDVRRRSVDAELAVHKFRSDNALTNVTLVTTLRQLELDASSLKSQYEQLLEYYQTSLQNQSLALTEARVISQPPIPGTPSFPNSSVTLAISFALGGLIGMGLAGVREYRERFFRTSSQVRDELGLETLGIIPLIEGKPGHREMRNGTAEKPSQIEVANSAYNWVEGNRRSEFAEAMRTVKVALDIDLQGKTTKTIGVVSCLPGEGKSLVSANLATMLAMQHHTTLLVDADMHNPGLSPMLASGWVRGFGNMLAGDFNPGDLLVHRSLPLRFLPCANHNQQTLRRPVRPIERMAEFLLVVGAKFNYVVVDLPPLAPIADVKSLAQHLDAVVLVIEWGSTARKFVRESVENNPFLRDKCIGVLLNKVDMKKIKRYQKFGSAEFYSSRYSQYYQV